ncbi:MAG: 1-deoxy-D-xylulose-5-phosphate reductoisomerase, partial [Acidimicrobiales bacterium]
MKTVSLVGSTGSIGTQALDVVDAEPDRYRVVALAAIRSVDRLVEQAHRLRPERVAIADAGLAAELEARVPAGVAVLAGPESLVEVASGADVVV